MNVVIPPLFFYVLVTMLVVFGACASSRWAAAAPSAS